MANDYIPNVGDALGNAFPSTLQTHMKVAIPTRAIRGSQSSLVLMSSPTGTDDHCEEFRFRPGENGSRGSTSTLT